MKVIDYRGKRDLVSLEKFVSSDGKDMVEDEENMEEDDEDDDLEEEDEDELDLNFEV